MDRDFGDDPFRKMERRKANARLGRPMKPAAGWDIEEPIVPGDQ